MTRQSFLISGPEKNKNNGERTSFKYLILELCQKQITSVFFWTRKKQHEKSCPLNIRFDSIFHESVSVYTRVVRMEMCNL